VGTINSIASNLGIDGNGATSTSLPPYVTAVPTPKDLVEIANVPAASQLDSLQTGDPVDLRAVLSSAVLQLQDASRQTSNPIEAAYLSSLADRFQRIQDGISVASA